MFPIFQLYTFDELLTTLRNAREAQEWELAREVLSELSTRISTEHYGV